MKKIVYVTGVEGGEMAAAKAALEIMGKRVADQVGQQSYTPEDLGLNIVMKSQPTGGGYGYSSDFDKQIEIIDGKISYVFVGCEPKDWAEDDQPVLIKGSRDKAMILKLIDHLSADDHAKKTNSEAHNVMYAVTNNRQFSPQTLRWFELVALYAVAESRGWKHGDIELQLDAIGARREEKDSLMALFVFRSNESEMKQT